MKRTVLIHLPDGATHEQQEVIEEFAQMLVAVTADGGRKRAAGLKPSWKVDLSHRAAIFSHLNKREHGELKDPDSGAHPYVHLAWRALAVAWQESATRQQLGLGTVIAHEKLLRAAGVILEKQHRNELLSQDEVTTLIDYHTLRIAERGAGNPAPQAILP